MATSSARTAGLLTILTAMAGLLVGVAATSAEASCAAEPEEAIAEQEWVFLATALEQTDRAARVEVEEVWRGPDLAPTVWVQTSAAELPPWPLRLVLHAATSVDAELVPGNRYVIATVDGGLATNGCLVADASEELAQRLAPEEPRPPVASGATGDGPGVLEGTSGVVLAIVLLAALPVVGWLAARRLRSARRAGRAG